MTWDQLADLAKRTYHKAKASGDCDEQEAWVKVAVAVYSQANEESLEQFKRDAFKGGL